MARGFWKSMSFRALIYPSEHDASYFIAHCLELDVIGRDRSIEGAIAQLLEAIETQLIACSENKAQLEFWAPGMIWYRYEQARRAGRKIADELLERIIKQANQRLGYESPINLDSIAGTEEVMDECQTIEA
jgi:pyruvate-formate lyase